VSLMCCRRSWFKGEKVLSVMVDDDLGVCVEFGDEKVDSETFGFAPTRAFMEALEKEIRFQMRNAGGMGGCPTLRRVYERFRRCLLTNRKTE